MHYHQKQFPIDRASDATLFEILFNIFLKQANEEKPDKWYEHQKQTIKHISTTLKASKWADYAVQA